MTKIATEDLRAVRGADDVPPPPVLMGDTFRLEPRATQVHVTTERPYYDFNIVMGDGRTAGRVQILMEPDSARVPRTGQICGLVAETWRGEDLLARAVRVLLPFAARHGFDEAMIVVPSRDAFFMKTCADAGGAAKDAIDIGGVPHTRFVVPTRAQGPG